MSMNSSERLGTLYRIELLRLTGLINVNGSVLDIGCNDGYLLSKLNSKLSVGIDLNPILKNNGLNIIVADGNHPPFTCSSFDYIFALDVIEHIKQDNLFAKSVLQLLSQHGKLVITTPSKEIVLFPGFLTGWISYKWGHYYRRGYTLDELTGLFQGANFQLKAYYWDAPYYRSYYLFIRALQFVFPGLSGKLIKFIASLDAKHPNNKNGFIILEVERV